jgi:magnesium chelatase subunit I
VSDLASLVPSTSGKIELDSLDEAGDEDLVARLTRQAVLSVFRSRVDPAELARAVAELDDGSAVEVGDDVASSAYMDALQARPALRAAVGKLAGSEQAAALAAAAEFILEGLHLSKRLNKHVQDGVIMYRGKRS